MCAENRGATASVALLQVSTGYSVNLHSASSAEQHAPGHTSAPVGVEASQRALQLAKLYQTYVPCEAD